MEAISRYEPIISKINRDRLYMKFHKDSCIVEICSLITKTDRQQHWVDDLCFNALETNAQSQQLSEKRD